MGIPIGDSPSHCVVPGERPGAVGAGDPDPLVPLPDVRAQVRLVAVGPLAERAAQFGACWEREVEWLQIRFMLDPSPDMKYQKIEQPIPDLHSFKAKVMTSFHKVGHKIPFLFAKKKLIPDSNEAFRSGIIMTTLCQM